MATLSPAMMKLRTISNKQSIDKNNIEFIYNGNTYAYRDIESKIPQNTVLCCMLISPTIENSKLIFTNSTLYLRGMDGSICNFQFPSCGEIQTAIHGINLGINHISMISEVQSNNASAIVFMPNPYV